MKEIGSFFEFPDFDCDDYENSIYANITKYGNYSFFRDGRHAIKVFLLKEDPNKIYYLPSYLCHSILQPFKELNLKIKFYNHEEPLTPLIDYDITDSVIFLLDYFGTECISKKNIEELLDNRNVVILDITHSMFNQNRFSINDDNFFMISSLRKTFPIPDGGILYHNNANVEIKAKYPDKYEKMLEAMIMKASYLRCGAMSGKNSKEFFLSIYKRYEKYKDLSFIIPQEIPDISTFILKNLDFNDIAKKRNLNLRFLYKNLKSLSLFKIKDIKSPFTFPISFLNFETKESFRKSLINNHIFPPVHWDLPKEVRNDFIYEKELSKRILSLPIDQRYGKNDMLRMSELMIQNIYGN